VTTLASFDGTKVNSGEVPCPAQGEFAPALLDSRPMISCSEAPEDERFLEQLLGTDSKRRFGSWMRK
jgi:hypothetical protein